MIFSSLDYAICRFLLVYCNQHYYYDKIYEVAKIVSIKRTRTVDYVDLFYIVSLWIL